MATPNVTRLLLAWKNGDDAAVEALMPLVYAELRRIAAAHLRRERPDHTLQPTALIHEAYLRLLNQDQPVWGSRLHFFAFASRIMRQVLVDSARKHRAGKRGHGAATRLTDAMAVAWEPAADLLQLNEALSMLAEIDDRKCRVIEMKYFGGLSRSEIAEALGVSDATVGRYTRLAEAWLSRQMAGLRSV